MVEYGLEWHTLDSYFQFKELLSAPATPEANQIRQYAFDSGGISTMCWKNDAGNITCLGTAGGTIPTGSGGAAGAVAVWTTATNIGADPTQFFWDFTNNRLGIGTIVPTTPLHIVPTVLTDGVVKAVAASSLGLSMFVQNTVGITKLFVAGASADFTPLSLAGDGGLIVTSTQKLLLSDAVKTRATLDASGDLFVGDVIANPFSAVAGRGAAVVRSNLPVEFSVQSYRNDATAPVATIRGLVARGTKAVPLATVTNDRLSIALTGHDGSAFVSGAFLEIGAEETWSTIARGSRMQFYTTPAGSVTVAERFRIGPAGQWGIGGATFGTAGNVFTSGGASAAPTWSAIPIQTSTLLNTAVHTDTLTGTVVRGDIIRGNSTPAWSRLAVGTTGQYLGSDGTDALWRAQSTLDHNVLANLTVGDVHTQYALLAGRSGGQTLKGGTAASEDLTLQGTSHATLGTVIIPDHPLGLTKRALRIGAANGWLGGILPAGLNVGGTITNTGVSHSAILVDCRFNGAANNPIGISCLPEIQPSATIDQALGANFIPQINPASGVTIGNLAAFNTRLDFFGNDGAVTVSQCLRIDTPIISGTLTPGTNYGINIINQGVAGITTAIGLRIAAQSGATNNYIFELPADATDPTLGGLLAAGRIPCLIGGVLRYLAYY